MPISVEEIYVALCLFADELFILNHSEQRAHKQNYQMNETAATTQFIISARTFHWTCSPTCRHTYWNYLGNHIACAGSIYGRFATKMFHPQPRPFALKTFCCLEVLPTTKLHTKKNGRTEKTTL